MNYDELLNLPSSVCFSGEAIKCFLDSLKVIEKTNLLHKKKFELCNYIIEAALNNEEQRFINEYIYIEEPLNRLIVFHYIPKISKENFDAMGIPFEVGDNGVYQNGVALSLIYNIEKGELVRTVYMR